MLLYYEIKKSSAIHAQGVDALSFEKTFKISIEEISHLFCGLLRSRKKPAR